MSGRRRSLAVAGLAVAGAAAAWLALPAPHRASTALAIAAAGLMAAVVLGPVGIPTSAARAAAGGAARAGRDLAEALALSHAPILVPAGGNLEEERLFLPSEGGQKPLPVLDAKTRLYVAPPGVRFGVAVEPPGLALVREAETATGVRLSGVTAADVGSFLQGLGARTLLMSEVRVLAREGEQHGTHEIRFRPGNAAPCRDTPGACATGLCPVCSAACVALARALGKPLILEASDQLDDLRLLRLREMMA